MDDALAQERLNLLLGLTNRVVSKLDLGELLREISGSIRGVMQCDGVAVILSDQKPASCAFAALIIQAARALFTKGTFLRRRYRRAYSRHFTRVNPSASQRWRVRQTRSRLRKA